jgi:Flp pilus assembly protein CpaB
MSIVLILNIVLATLVIAGIVGMLAWSIVSQNVDASAAALPSRRRRRATPPVGGTQVLAHTGGNRA